MSSLDYLITHHGVNTNMNSFDRSILNGVVAELAAESLLSYVHDYLKRNFIAILFTSNKYAINFQSHFLTEAKKVGLNTIAFGYNVGNNHSLPVALEKIKQSNFRTIIVAPQESPFAAIEHLIEKAVKNELVGSDFLWICHHYNRLSIELMKDVQPILMENKGGQDTIVSTFMQGLGLFVPSINKYYIERGYDSSESSYSSIVDFCQSDNENAHVFNDICGTTDNWNIPVDALSSAFAYDSMKASLNRLMDSSSSTQTIFRNFFEYEFVGMTGNISFDSVTHTRSNSSMQFDMFNFQKNEDSFRLVNTAEDRGDSVWTKLADFQYADLTYNIPVVEYGVEENKGYIDSNLRKICVSVASCGILVTLYCIAKVWIYKGSDQLALIQPLFLFMICGTSLLRYMTAIAIFIDDGVSFVSSEGMYVVCTLRFWPAALGQITCQFIYIVKFLLIENDVNTNTRSNWMIVLYYFPFCLMTMVYIFLFYILVSFNTAMYWTRENLLEDNYGFVVASEGKCKLKEYFVFRMTLSIFIAALGVVAVIIIGRRCQRTISSIEDFCFHEDFKRIHYCSYYDSVIFSLVILHSFLTWIFLPDTWYHSRTYESIRFVLIFLLAAGNVHVIVYNKVRRISDMVRENKLKMKDDCTAGAVCERTDEEGQIDLGNITNI